MTKFKDHTIDTKAELEKMTLMHDILMTRVFNKDKALVQYVLRIILGRDDLTVLESEVQKEMYASPDGKAIRLDVYAKDKNNTYYDIEIQRVEKNFSMNRMRFYQSVNDINHLNRGESYETLPKTIIIFILGYDYYKDGLPYHQIQAVDKQLNQDCPEVLDWYILNQKYLDTKTDFGKLMHDLGCAKPSEILLPPIAKRVQYYKEGAMSMSVEEDIYEMFKDKIDAAKSEGIKLGEEKGIEKGALETQKSIILTLSKKGYSAEEISTMLDIPLKEVETALSK